MGKVGARMQQVSQDLDLCVTVARWVLDRAVRRREGETPLVVYSWPVGGGASSVRRGYNGMEQETGRRTAQADRGR